MPQLRELDGNFLPKKYLRLKLYAQTNIYEVFINSQYPIQNLLKRSNLITITIK